MWRFFYSLLSRDLVAAYRSGSEFLNPVTFFVIVVSLFPLAVTPDPETLTQIASGVLWVSALLATLLSLDSLYRQDYDDGSLEQLLMMPHSKILVVLAKVCAHWIKTGLPLILVSPLLGMMLFLSTDGILAVMASLLVGTPTMSLIGAIGMGLTVALGRGGMLLSILVLPLYIPILIFGSSAVASAQMGLEYSGQLAFMGAFLIMALMFAPVAAAGALKVAVR